MAKTSKPPSSKAIFACSSCGSESPKWLGQCPSCNEWNTLEERKSAAGGATRFAPLAKSTAAVALSAVRPRDIERISTGVGEFDRVLGGGLVVGGVVLLGGDPGIGKSTLLLQALAHVSKTLEVLYVTGEESVDQVALRAQRIGVDGAALHTMAEISVDRIVQEMEARRPAFVVVDSIQTVYSEELSAAPGSVSQIKECAATLTRAAKREGVSMVLVGHVTKEGDLAGPRVLEHIVDTVLFFDGQTHSSFRAIRAHKNRFGPVNELGVFSMGDTGLKEVTNPSAMFLSFSGTEAGSVPGTCVLITQEGTRPLLVEIQALVDEAPGNPRRLALGVEGARLSMLLAVVSRHLGIPMGNQDCYVNAVGGVRIEDPGGDLAVVLATISSLKNRALPRGLAVFGEVGLAGEIRPCSRGQERIREAQKLGFSHVLLPKANMPRGGTPFEGVTLIPVGRLQEATDLMRNQFERSGPEKVEISS
jgi:DNA repair protein RadA/Sms